MRARDAFLAGFDSRGGRAALICLCVLLVLWMIHEVVRQESDRESRIARLSEVCASSGGKPSIPPASFMHGGAGPEVLCEKE